MEKLHQGFGGKGLVILAVNFRESPKQVRAFLKEHKLTFKILLDPKGAVSRLYTTWSLPVTFIVNKRGERVGMAIGHREWDTPDAKEYFRRLLDEKQ